MIRGRLDPGDGGHDDNDDAVCVLFIVQLMAENKEDPLLDIRDEDQWESAWTSNPVNFLDHNWNIKKKKSLFLLIWGKLLIKSDYTVPSTIFGTPSEYEQNRL